MLPDELGSIKGHGFYLIPIGIILPRKGNLSILKAEDPMIGNGDSVGVPSEILKNRLRAEGGLAVDDPFLDIEPGQESGELVFHTRYGSGEHKLISLVRPLQKREELSPEQP
jgi:hypothetical protein